MSSLRTKSANTSSVRHSSHPRNRQRLRRPRQEQASRQGMNLRGRSSYQMNSNRVRARKSNENHNIGKGTFSNRPTHADHLQTSERRSGAVVPRGRVLQLTRELLHRGGADSWGVARKAGRTVGIAQRSARGTFPTALRRTTPDHWRAAHPPPSSQRIYEQARRESKRDGTPRRMGCDVFGTKERIVDCPCRWR